MTINRFLLIAVTLLCGTLTLQAAAPLGYPGGLLEKGRWQVGAEFAQGQADSSAQGQCTETVIGVGSQSYHQTFQIEKLKTQALFAQLAYGLTGTWDVYARLGAVQAQADIRVPGVTLGTANAGRTRLDGNYGFAAGLGTRATFYRKGGLSLTGLLQGTWFEPEESQRTYHYPAEETLVTNTRLRYFQAQLSVAALHQEEHWSLWMGPFLQYTQGHIDLAARYYFHNAAAGSITCTGDLDDPTRLGILLGGGVRNQRLACRLTAQFTSESWLWGLSGTIAVK